jgi:hypothetical protein
MIDVIILSSGGEVRKTCDITVKKNNICAAFGLYEWGLSRCVEISGEVLDMTCAALDNVKVIFFSTISGDNLSLYI